MFLYRKWTGLLGDTVQYTQKRTIVNCKFLDKNPPDNIGFNDYSLYRYLPQDVVQLYKTWINHFKGESSSF